MLIIKTKYEWKEFFEDLSESVEPWYSLKNRFEVKLPEDKVKQREVDIQYWIVTNFGYDVYCIVDSVRCKLSEQVIHTIKTNVRANNLTTETRKWGIKREVPNSEEEIQKYIDGALAWHTRFSTTDVHSFYFLSEEDAVAFKLRWL